MYGYKLKLDGLPTPVWACETTVTNYSWESHREILNRMEFSIIKAPYLIRNINNTNTISENVYAFSCVIADGNKISCYSHPESPVSITTVAVEFKKMEVIYKKLDIDDCTDHTFLLMPVFLDSISIDELDEINVLLHKYIMHYDKNTERDKAICYTIIYELLSNIDLRARNILRGTDKKRYNHYVKKINWIIQDRYNTKITKAEIAKELGISVGYLANIYKKSTGKTISEQLLATRMHKAELLLENYSMPTSKIAESVGYDDEAYFREKFRQYFGMSIKEYKNIKHGNTLYHKKPTKS